MGKLEKLQVVETAIRKALPRLMKPTEGCWLYLKGYDKCFFKIIHRRSNEFLVDDYKGHKPKTYKNNVLKDYFEIIGHDILVLDVLEWLGYKGKNGEYDYSVLNLSNNILNVNLVTQISDVEHHAYEEIWDKIEIDLSKPRLADQSEKTINVLYDFINCEE